MIPIRHREMTALRETNTSTETFLGIPGRSHWCHMGQSLDPKEDGVQNHLSLPTLSTPVPSFFCGQAPCEALMSQKGFGFIQKAQSMACQGALGKLRKQAWFAPPSEFFPSISAPAPCSAVPDTSYAPPTGTQDMKELWATLSHCQQPLCFICYPESFPVAVRLVSI